MGETTDQDGEASSTSTPDIINIAPDGNIILDVTFHNSPETLKAARKAASTPSRSSNYRTAKNLPAASVPKPILQPELRIAYRVQLAALTKNSRFFATLLGDTRFQEAQTVAAALSALSLRDAAHSPAPSDLPWVRIEDDDLASRSAGRELVFADLMRILHGTTSMTPPSSLLHITVLALIADRFDCIPPVAAYVRGLKIKTPVMETGLRDEKSCVVSAQLVNEENVRQKVLVAWLLDLPVIFQAGTRELIMFGSKRWRLSGEDEDAQPQLAAWWELPDDIENELEHRRACILSCIASVQRCFLAQYASRERQCKLGYDNSAACDSFQLGEMIRFLAGRNLLTLQDFGSFYSPPGAPCVPALAPPPADFAQVGISNILDVLKQCPSYQVDKHHTNCGLRTRIVPVLEFLQARVLSKAVPITLGPWRDSRGSASWMAKGQKEALEHRGFWNKSTKGAATRRIFQFTRSLATDQRLLYEGAMGADSMAEQLFTADGWDWVENDTSMPRSFMRMDSSF